MLCPSPCACIRSAEHLGLSALGGFSRSNLVNVPIAPWPENSVCSCSLERLSGERDVEIQVSETKKEQ